MRPQEKSSGLWHCTLTVIEHKEPGGIETRITQFSEMKVESGQNSIPTQDRRVNKISRCSAKFCQIIKTTPFKMIWGAMSGFLAPLLMKSLSPLLLDWLNR